VIDIPLDQKVYQIRLTMDLMCEIEKEMGCFSSLISQFKNEQWSLSEVVTLIHIMLASGGHEIDYMDLGNKILGRGLMPYCELIGTLIEKIILGKQTQWPEASVKK